MTDPTPVERSARLRRRTPLGFPVYEIDAQTLTAAAIREGIPPEPTAAVDDFPCCTRREHDAARDAQLAPTDDEREALARLRKFARGIPPYPNLEDGSLTADISYLLGVFDVRRQPSPTPSPALPKPDVVGLSDEQWKRIVSSSRPSPAPPTREALAAVIDPEAWRDRAAEKPNPADIWPDDLAAQTRYEEFYVEGIAQSQRLSLDAADAVIALLNGETK